MNLFEKRQKFLLESLKKKSDDPDNAHLNMTPRQVSETRRYRENPEIDIEELLRNFNGPRAR
jgi:hypothetical protein